MSDDIRQHMEQSFRVRNTKMHVVRFGFNFVQNKYWAQKTRRDIILKARQQGFSTLVVYWFLTECLINENVRAVIISHDKDATRKLMNRARLCLKWLKEDMLKAGVEPPKIGYDTKDQLTFPETESELYIGTAGTKSFGRGDTISHLHCSELAFWENPSDIMTGILQSVPFEGHVIIECTANGIGNYFHRLWQRTKKGETAYTPHFFPWQENPEYRLKVPDKFILTEEEKFIKKQFKISDEQLVWRRWKLSEFEDPEMFKQEYPSTELEAFLSSGRPFFVQKKLHEMIGNVAFGNEPLIGDMTVQNGFTLMEKGYVKLWKKPEHGAHYSIGADVAEGLSHGDYSCAVVLDNKTHEHVATWHGHADPDNFAKDLIRLGRFYNNAMIGCEINNHGIVVNNKLRDSNYPNIYRRMEFDRMYQTMIEKIGWRTDSKSRPIMLDALSQEIRDNQFITWDKDLIEEAQGFNRNDKGRPQADKGYNDDRIIAAAIALQMANLHPVSDEEIRLPEHVPADPLTGY